MTERWTPVLKDIEITGLYTPSQVERGANGVIIEAEPTDKLDTLKLTICESQSKVFCSNCILKNLGCPRSLA